MKGEGSQSFLASFIHFAARELVPVVQLPTETVHYPPSARGSAAAQTCPPVRGDVARCSRDRGLSSVRTLPGKLLGSVEWGVVIAK